LNSWWSQFQTDKNRQCCTYNCWQTSKNHIQSSDVFMISTKQLSGSKRVNSWIIQSHYLQ
jgi:hypothetical protein